MSRYIIMPSPAQTGIFTTVSTNLVLHLDAGNSSSYPGSGTTWTDLSGSGNNGTLVNNVVYNSAGYLTFSGVVTNSPYVNIPNSTSINNPLSGDFTYEMWTRPKTGGQNRYGKLFAKGQYLSTTGFNGLMFDNVPGSIIWEWGNPNSQLIVVMESFGTLNNWHHLVITRNSGTFRTYFNGQLFRTYTNTVDYSSTFPLRLSANGNAAPGDAGAQDLAVFKQYSVSLNASEVYGNFQAGRGRFGI